MNTVKNSEILISVHIVKEEKMNKDISQLLAASEGEEGREKETLETLPVRVKLTV